jgi:hypothetical protein
MASICMGSPTLIFAITGVRGELSSGGIEMIGETNSFGEMRNLEFKFHRRNFIEEVRGLHGR